MSPPDVPQEFETYITFGTAMGVVTQLYATRLETMLARFDLTVAQFSILNHLARRMPDGQGITAIAAAVEVKQPAVSKTIIKFETLGWVYLQATSGDARAKIVRLTEQGGAHLRHVHQAILPDYTQMLEGWSADDLGRLTASLQRLSAWLDANRLR